MSKLLSVKIDNFRRLFFIKFKKLFKITSERISSSGMDRLEIYFPKGFGIWVCDEDRINKKCDSTASRFYVSIFHVKNGQVIKQVGAESNKPIKATIKAFFCY